MPCGSCVARSSSASTTSTPRRSTRASPTAPGRGTTSRPLDIANELIREALAPYPDDLLIATKVGPTASGLARPDQLAALVEADLRALGRDHLDLVYLRQGGLESVAEHFGVLAELQQAGLIRHLGISSVRPEHLTQAQEVAPVAAVSNRYAVDFGRVNDEPPGHLRGAGHRVRAVLRARRGRAARSAGSRLTTWSVRWRRRTTQPPHRCGWPGR